MTKTTKKKTEKAWMLTCRGPSTAVWPVLIARTRIDLLDRGAQHFRVTPEYLKDRMGMKPVRVTLTYQVPK